MKQNIELHRSSLFQLPEF